MSDPTRDLDVTATAERARARLDNLPASSRPAWYRARVNSDDAWWESLVQAECEAGHVIFVDDGDGTVYACPACALAAVADAPGLEEAPEQALRVPVGISWSDDPTGYRVAQGKRLASVVQAWLRGEGV